MQLRQSDGRPPTNRSSRRCWSAVFVPVIGNLRTRTLTLWLGGALALCIGLISLFPLVVLPIILAFLAAFPFTGLAALSRTGHATGGLIAALIVLVTLINCHFQAGDLEPGRSKVLVYASYAAAFTLVPLLALTPDAPRAPGQSCVRPPPAAPAG